MTCRSGSPTQTVAAIGSRSGSFAQWGTSPGAPSCRAWRRSRASRSLTGMRSSAPWAAPRRGWYAKRPRPHKRGSRPLPRRRAVLVRVAPAARAKRLVGKIRAEDGQHEDAIDELLLTDTLDGDGGAIEDGDRGGERPNDQRGAGGV